MGHEPVPWAIGGGAQMSATVARLLAYLGGGGETEGVAAPTSCAVAAMPTPGASVRVAPGPYLIRNRALAGDYQDYVGMVRSQDVVNVTATSSAGPRSDLVVIRVENPFISGEPWQVPTDVANGPYVFTRVIENVPADTTSVHALNLGYTAITLARIDIPASTATITDAMITDLRTVVNPGTGTGGQPPPGGGGDGGDDGGGGGDGDGSDALITRSGTTTPEVLDAAGHSSASTTDFTLTATVLDAHRVRIDWTTTRTDITGWTAARDGVDTQGTGAWSTAQLDPGVRSWTFNLLVSSDTYTFTLTPQSGTTTLPVITVQASPTGTVIDQAWQDWPSFATWDYTIPHWATHADINITLAGCKLEDADLSGSMQLLIGSISKLTQDWTFDYPGQDVRQTIAAAGHDVPIDAGFRGTKTTFTVQNKITAGTGKLAADASTVMTAQLAFKGKPVTS